MQLLSIAALGLTLPALPSSPAAGPQDLGWIESSAPVRSVHLALDPEGGLHPASGAEGIAPGAVSFSNVDATQIFSLFLSDTQELVDYGVKTGGLSEVLTSVRISYLADALDTSVGGPGASAVLNLYFGANGDCLANPFAPGALAVSLTLDGLPASLAAPLGEILDVTIDLTGAGIALPDGPIGWGLSSPDLTLLPRLVNLGEDPTGTENFLDVLDGGTCTGSAFFLLGNRQVSSFFLELTESGAPAPCGLSSYGPFDVTPAGTLTASGGNGPGDTITFESDFAGAEGPGFLVLSSQPEATEISGVELLVDLEDTLSLIPFAATPAGAGVSISVPDSASIAGETFFLQAALADPQQPGGFQVTNGIRFDVCP